MIRFAPLRSRQIHMDFHTCEHIEGVAADFDADAIAAGLADAAVDCVAVFAKCHHGWSYYPTKAGAPHPHLTRPDLMGEMIAGCTARGIEVPVYISVQWDERIARPRPEWRSMSAQNKVLFAAPDDTSAQNQLSAAWHTLCLSNRGYIDEQKAQTTEVLETYPVPGLFYDILTPTDCVCTNCLARMAADGRDPEDPKDRRDNDLAILDEFRAEMTAHIHAIAPDVRVFYNAGHIAKWGRSRYDDYSHLELESLPTGGWGYNHFPGSARYVDPLGLDFLGHTGKFHTAWGEFGGFKHPHALIYETAQMSALGSKCLVGDQLHPSGALNPDTYASIAPAYRRIRDLEPVLDGATYLAEVAILASEYFHRDAGARYRPADDGAAQMLLEAQVPFDIIGPEADLAKYRLLILPDDIPVGAPLAARLAAYRAGGGAMTLADRIVVLNAGRIEQLGTPQELYDRPANTFVAQFMGSPAMNILKGADFPAGLAPVAGTTALGVRPEHVAITQGGAAQMTVETVEFLGGTRYVYGTLGNTQMIAEKREGSLPNPGEAVGRAFAANQMHHFDAEGRRLG